MLDFSIARENMVESQVRPNGITDHKLIDAMLAVPREEFVPEELRSIAYMDEDIVLPVGEGNAQRFLLEPMAYARLVQAANIVPSDIVLDVAGASGYSAAVLSYLAQTVVSVESDASLAKAANESLLRQEITNVAIVSGNLQDGHASDAPYDVIIINGRVADVPQALLDQLAEGGRLVAVVGATDMAQAFVYKRTKDGFAKRHAFDASIPALPEFAAPAKGFEF